MSALMNTFSAVSKVLADKAKAEAFQQLEDPSNQQKAVDVILAAPIPDAEKKRIAAALRAIADRVIQAPPTFPPVGGRRRRTTRRSRRRM
jgi:F0F1-type ATP synthase delta subunit